MLILEHRHRRSCRAVGQHRRQPGRDRRRDAIVGRIGDDADGARWRRSSASAGSTSTGLVRQRGYVTPTKTRIMAGSPHTAKQQIVRMDRGAEASRCRRRSAAGCWRRGPARRKRGGAGAGRLRLRHGRPGWPRRAPRRPGALMLDSRFALDAFSGVSAATPNLRRSSAPPGSTSTTTTRRGSRRRPAACGAPRARSPAGDARLPGMTLLASADGRRPIPIFGSDEIADVTGAGDTVIAMFTAALAAGAAPARRRSWPTSPAASW